MVGRAANPRQLAAQIPTAAQQKLAGIARDCGGPTQQARHQVAVDAQQCLPGVWWVIPCRSRGCSHCLCRLFAGHCQLHGSQPRWRVGNWSVLMLHYCCQPAIGTACCHAGSWRCGSTALGGCCHTAKCTRLSGTRKLHCTQFGPHQPSAWITRRNLCVCFGQLVSHVLVRLALLAGADNGSLWFWDWTSGNSFQQQDTIVQPGSLDSEAGAVHRHAHPVLAQGVCWLGLCTRSCRHCCAW